MIASIPVKPPSPDIAVGSGLGGAARLARGSFSMARLRSSIVARNWRNGLANGWASVESALSVEISGLLFLIALLPAFDEVPSERSAGSEASENGPSRAKKVFRSG